MGQKVNPHGLRVGVIKDWDSRWYAEDSFADYLKTYSYRMQLINGGTGGFHFHSIVIQEIVHETEEILETI